MTLLPNNENFSAASGIINSGFLEAMYHSIIDETFLDLGRTITLHLPPAIEADTASQSLPQGQQYNSFFGRVPVPTSNTRGAGVKIESQEVQYKAHIKVGPLKAGDDLKGIGDLEDNEAAITVVIEALEHIKAAHKIDIEGRFYRVDKTRPIGFNQRRYMIVKLQEIQDAQAPSPDNTIG